MTPTDPELDPPAEFITPEDCDAAFRTGVSIGLMQPVDPAGTPLLLIELKAPDGGVSARALLMPETAEEVVLSLGRVCHEINNQIRDRAIGKDTGTDDGQPAHHASGTIKFPTKFPKKES